MLLTMVSVRKPSCTTYRELAEYGNAFSCLICVDTPSSPRALSCGHVFCETCLESYQRLFGGWPEYVEGGRMPCPVCRKMTLPIDDVSGGGDTSSMDATPTGESGVVCRKVSLANEGSQRCEPCVYRYRFEEADFYCSKCAMSFCSSCKLLHDQTQVFKGHTIIHVRNKDTFSLYCDTHSKIVCMYFCHDCDRPVCTVCVLQSHRQHRTAKLRDALAGRRDLLKTLLNDFGPKLERLEMKLKKIQVTGGNGLHPVNGTLANGGGTPAANHRKTSPRSTTLRNGGGSTGGQERTRKNGILSVDSIPNSQCFSNGDSESLNAAEMSSISDGESGFREVNPEDVASHVCRNRKLYDLSTKLLELSQSKKLLAVFQDVASRLRTVLELEFQRMHDDLEDQLTRVIELSVRSLDPPHGGSDPESGSSTASSIRARHSSGVSSVSGLDADGSDGGSQSMLIRPKLVWKLEKQRSDVGEMWNPCGAAFIRDDGLVVAEYDMLNDRNNKLRIFTREGGSHAVLAQGQIQPLGVAITREGHIAVTDCKGKRVKVLTLNGQTIIDIGKGQFGWPYGIATNSRGQLVVTDAFNDSVSIYHVDGKRIRTFGSSGSQNSQFRNPYHVTVDASDNIIVSDSGNNSIKAFDPSGRFLFATSETGVRRASMDLAFDAVPDRKTKRRRLKGPRGLSVDLRGNILVADDCSRVCMFDGAGKYVRNLLTEEDSVKYPEVVQCGPTGLLAVTEWNPANMYAVKMFKLYE